MRTPAQIAGHPIHPMLVSIPIGLWIFSLVCDFLALRSGALASWQTASLYAMVGGIIGALAAAIPGLVDLMSLRDKPIFSTALTHMGLNLAIVVLYVVNAWLRMAEAATAGTPLVLSLVAIAMLLVSGWLGGKMVYEAGVGVHAEEMAASATPAGGWRQAGGASASRAGWTPTAANPDRAMASDSSRPRDTGRAERPGAENLGK
ncbi:DUF2231 domain-containing protein [Ramlibacter tataouinensis]|uniref:DUF2231 domain-containing protein n=1 Tax=Ramlibacter tataouinensis TaxID=94132 RepID=UPI0022F3FE51|nr:DUF2231 domain-containing protein [Ramlibacter tataouinensis]WBY02499.1 DUF2231 domain-containing protein [Ramlibacter tataouinensis]